MEICAGSYFTLVFATTCREREEMERAKKTSRRAYTEHRTLLILITKE